MKVRFLLDENESPRLKAALLRFHPTMDVLRIGDPGAPQLGTPDPDILRYLETSQRMFVTSNRTTMPEHIQAHWAANGHLWGVFWIRRGMPIGQVARDLVLVWQASEAEEWIDRLDWIPF
jgi:hypothetical protein